MPGRIILVSAVALLSLGAAMAGTLYFRPIPAKNNAEGRHAPVVGEHASAGGATATHHGDHHEPEAEIALEEASHPAHSENQHAAETSPSEPAEKSRFRSGPAYDVVLAALNSFSPESGLRQLEEALALPHTPEQAALLHEARGELFAQLAVPDFVQSQAAFEKALEMTSDDLLEEEIRHKAVQMLIQGGKDGEAMKVASAQLKLHPPASDAGFKLQLLLGQLQERGVQPDLAEQSYRAVLDAMAAMPAFLSAEESVSLARLAVLRLSHLYRSSDRDQDLDAVVAALKKHIARARVDSET